MTFGKPEPLAKVGAVSLEPDLLEMFRRSTVAISSADPIPPLASRNNLRIAVEQGVERTYWDEVLRTSFLRDMPMGSDEPKKLLEAVDRLRAGETTERSRQRETAMRRQQDVQEILASLSTDIRLAMESTMSAVRVREGIELRIFSPDAIEEISTDARSVFIERLRVLQHDTSHDITGFTRNVLIDPTPDREGIMLTSVVAKHATLIPHRWNQVWELFDSLETKLNGLKLLRRMERMEMHETTKKLRDLMNAHDEELRATPHTPERNTLRILTEWTGLWPELPAPGVERANVELTARKTILEHATRWVEQLQGGLRIDGLKRYLDYNRGLP